MSKVPYVEIEHTADWSLRIEAGDMRGLLINAARGMFQMMQIRRGEHAIGTRRLDLSAQDREELLVSWLEELLFHLETRGVIFVIEDLKLTSKQHQLEASVKEYPIASLEKEIKAVTYHGLRVVETERGVEATIVFDV